MFGYSRWPMYFIQISKAASSRRTPNRPGSVIRLPCMSMRSASWFRLTLLALAGTGILLACRLAAADDESAPAPVAIRRLLLTPDQVVQQMDRVRQGSLVLLPRTEFEERVRRAKLAADAARQPPRLIEAHYHARVAGSALEEGTAEWKIANPSRTAAILPIPVLNLALTQARVETGSKKATPAVLGDLGGKGLGLLVGPSVEMKVHLGWTARGEERAGDLHFSLQMPPCPVATLDLDLPAGRAVVPGEQFLVSGPFAAKAPDRRRWRIAFASRATLELVVRAELTATRATPPVLAQLRTTQVLEPDLLTGDFEFNIEVPQHQVGSLTFLCDPSLHPTDVQAPDLASWEAHTVASGK